MATIDQRLEAVYGAAGKRETLDRLYDEWAGSYDADLWATGNPYIAIIAAMVGRHVADFEARILDGGCGSGLLGQILRQVGYRRLDGLDASEGMLSAARHKGCYETLHHLLLGARIELVSASYDAVVAAGVLTHGHAPPDSLDGMVALAKPGAPIIFSISRIAMEEGGFGEKISQLETEGAWRLVEQTAPFHSFPFSEEYAHLQHWVCVYRKS